MTQTLDHENTSIENVKTIVLQQNFIRGGRLERTVDAR
jgi:hypothetical protein|tara:strand:- start:10365 stop:10478 length:114 start_codon:yes stop_codon:yes gene_type:complete